MTKKGDEKKNRDSVTKKEDGNPKVVGKSTQRGGEELAMHSKEAGRKEHGERGKGGRPAGTSTARDSTGIDPQDPIDPKSPNFARGGG
jgi:hypothetical protein